jgi:hypothetical protein
MFDYGTGNLFKVLNENMFSWKNEKIELATQELINFMGENGCNNKVEAVYYTAQQNLKIRSIK